MMKIQTYQWILKNLDEKSKVEDFCQLERNQRELWERTPLASPRTEHLWKSMGQPVELASL
jgi:hypothetical protein